MKNRIKIMDLIIVLILVVIVICMITFASSRETGNQEIILMEIYKCAGPSTSSNTMNHYYVYNNTNTVKIRTSNADGSHSTSPKEINQDLIDEFKIELDKYISQSPIIYSGFNINERYAIEYNGKTVIVPNPNVAELLGYDSNQYIFYNDVDNFINIINN